MDYVTRAEWGAAPPLWGPYRQPTPTEAYLHHTAGAYGGGAARMRAIQRYHQSPDPARGKAAWSDIAYNFVLDPETLLWYEGRGGLVVPGAQKGHNRGTVALCVMGDFRTDPIGPDLYQAIADMVTYLGSRGWGPARLTGGHRDAPNQSTTCPGRLDWRAVNALIDEGDDMPLTDEDIRRIWAFPTLTAGVTAQLALTRTERGVNQLLLAELDDAAEIADLVVAQLGEDLASEVADELARRLAT